MKVKEEEKEKEDQEHHPFFQGKKKKTKYGMASGYGSHGVFGGLSSDSESDSDGGPRA